MVLICRCSAGAFLAANLPARAAAGGCSQCNSDLFVPGMFIRDSGLTRGGFVRYILQIRISQQSLTDVLMPLCHLSFDKLITGFGDISNSCPMQMEL